ncbi:MAG TPA: cell wall hydrolase [Xanthobacteraceae bacterium]|nr:cell wall hydrolase [Xanthobacteraceae bacterium]
MRQRPKRSIRVRFGFLAFGFVVLPNQIAYQDLGSLIAHQPVVERGWRQYVLSAPLGTVHTATFSFSRPLGTAMPTPFSMLLASLDPRTLALDMGSPAAVPKIRYPIVQRARKGDRLSVPKKEPSARMTPPADAPTSVYDIREANFAPAQSITVEAVEPFKPFPDYDISMSLEGDPGILELKQTESTQPVASAEPSPSASSPVSEIVGPDGDTVAAATPAIAPATSAPAETSAAQADEAIAQAATMVEQAAGQTQAAAVSEDAPAMSPPSTAEQKVQQEAADAAWPPPPVGNQKVAAQLPTDDGSSDDDAGLASSGRLFFGAAPLGEGLSGMMQWQPGEEPVFAAQGAQTDPDLKIAALDPSAAPDAAAGPAESVAPKGHSVETPKRPKSPAERLHLEGKKRARAEKCLANAVYFESRGESERGQMAVAQVVMNRVFSDFYPNDVCGVVYQNAGRHLACQFTFACDGIPDVVREKEAWVVAERIARDTLDGKIWVTEVGKATHYHAYWVHPRWVREMKKLDKIGVHTFYRPRAWGTGADEPHWGPTAAVASKAKS